MYGFVEGFFKPRKYGKYEQESGVLQIPLWEYLNLCLLMANCNPMVQVRGKITCTNGKSAARSHHAFDR